MTLDLALLSLLWILYFALHSLFASLWLKSRIAARFGALMPSYRLIFNALATILLIPPVLLMLWLKSDPLWQFEGIWHWLRIVLLLLTLAGFVWSLRYYDSKEFLGLKQLRQGRREIEDQESLQISPLHRYVRHPWYSLGLILVWSQDMDAARLVSAILISAYLVVGSRFEEQKLMRYHGEKYRRYCERVPGLIPIPGRRLTQAEAEKLMLQE
jgi:protein-S-isoprenylcysteine O-methyltransferase Ste14